jgi:trans-aconitate 2-methyltransferase
MASEWDAATYDRVADHQARWGASVVERVPAGARLVLDAGCGSGRVSEQLLARLPEARLIALDASERMLEAARRRLEPHAARVRFVRAELGRPLPPLPAVDAVLSTATFHWVADHDALFASLAAVLRPGGALVAQWGGEGNIAAVVAALEELGRPPRHWSFSAEAETRRRLAAAGFVDIEVWSHPEPAPFAGRRELEEFLRTSVLVRELDGLPAAEADVLVAAVADRLPEPRLDYVRLNALARRPASDERALP